MSDEGIGWLLLLAMTLVALNVAGLLAWIVADRVPKRRSS